MTQDGFEISTHPTGFRSVATSSAAPGANGIPFYAVKGAGGTSTIVADGAFGGNALDVSGTTVSTNYPVVGLLPIYPTLTNVGDTVSLSFRFRFTNQGTATAANSNLRFGLHSSAGTTVSGDGQTSTSDNDVGYYVQIGDAAHTATDTLFFNENGGTTTILSGTDRSSIAASSLVGGIANNNVHAVLFTLTRSSPTAIGLSLSIDGGTAVTGSSTSNLRTLFDQVSFSNSFVLNPMQYRIDDVEINATSFQVPEPSFVAMAMGVPMLLLRRRRG